MGGTIAGTCDRCGLKIDIDPMRDPEELTIKTLDTLCDDCMDEIEAEEKYKELNSCSF